MIRWLVRLWRRMFSRRVPVRQGPLKPERCRITLKSGQLIEIDLSATRVKHIRRSKGMLPMQGPNGKHVLLPAKYIDHVEALAPVNP